LTSSRARVRHVLVALALAATLLPAAAAAYVVEVAPAHRLTMTLALLPDTPFTTIGFGQQSWNSLAEAALARWNGVGVGVGRDHAFFTSVRSTLGDTCSRPTGINQVMFARDVCGRSFADAVAITLTWSANGKRIEGDVFVNTAYTFNGYPGPLRASASSKDGILYDLHRVLLHEFGHVIGLAHPDDHGQQVPAVMNKRISGIDDLQADDVAGAHAVLWGESLTNQFVRGFYETALGREPTEAELAAWITFLRTSPGSANAIVQGFFHSPEFLRNREGTLGDYITALYTTVLLRQPSSAEVAAWMPAMLERVNRLVPGFVNSAEFQRVLASTAPATIIRRLYQQVLLRQPSTAEVNAWVAEVGRTGDWYGAALGFLNSAEFLARPRTFADHVEILYRTFLGRTPSDPELTAWLDLLTAQFIDVENAFTASPEFQQQIVSLIF
jgi:hypothetical protein